jgi:DNA-binding FadR family transcriptional regulator
MLLYTIKCNPVSSPSKTQLLVLGWLNILNLGLAAERAQPSNIEAMEETIRALTKPGLTAAEVAEADVAFHNQLALAADNPLFSVLAGSINNVMIEICLRACRLDGTVVAAERAVVYHSRILERVKAHDVEGARHAMMEHLAEARDTLRRANHSLGTPESNRKR